MMSPREWHINNTPERKANLLRKRAKLPEAERRELEIEIAAKWAEAGFTPKSDAE